MSGRMTRPSADREAGGIAAVEAVLRDAIGLDPATIGTAAVERAARTRMAAAAPQAPALPVACHA